MSDNQIPPVLLEKYNIYKDDKIKYSCLNIDNLESEYLDKENSMVNSLNSFKQSLEKIFEKISEFVLNNKNTFNDTCLENEIKSLDYLVILQSIICLVNVIIVKLENKESENETFQSICDKIFPKYPKVVEIQYPKDNPTLISNLENYVKSIVEHSTGIKNSSNKPGIILTILMCCLNIKIIPKVMDSIKKFEEITNFKDSAYFNNQTKNHEMILFDLLSLLKGIKELKDLIYFGYLVDENDLINKKDKSEEWDTIKKLVWTVKLKKDIDIDKIMREMRQKNILRLGQMQKMMSGDGPKIGAMFGALFNNVFNSAQVEYEAKKIGIKLYGFMIQPPNQTVKFNKMVKKMMSSRLPSIACKKKLYLRREYKPITLEYIKELNDFLNGKTTEPKDKSILLFDENYKMSEETLKKQIFATKLEKNEKEDYISTRIFNNSTLLFKGEKLEKKGFFGKKKHRAKK